MPHILIVEDEPSIADTLLFALAEDGHSTQWLSLAGSALDYLANHAVDLVILDVGLPDMSGFEACKRLRRNSDVPVLFLTARGNEIDRVVGLEIGADDYVVKPFSPREVCARVRSILKRSRNRSSAEVQTTEFAVDSAQLRIHFRGQPLALTPHEFHILCHLLSQPRRVFSREQLLQAAGIAADAGYERNIDSHIKSLRAKLRQIAPDAEPIQTQRGFGYSYQPETTA